MDGINQPKILEIFKDLEIQRKKSISKSKIELTKVKRN